MIAETVLQNTPEVVSQDLDVANGREVACKYASLPEGSREQCTFRSGAPSALVLGTVNERFDLHAVADVECADALRRVKLVSGYREQVNAEIVHQRWDFADRLRRIRVEGDPMLSGDCGAALDRLDRANLIVGVHDADQDGIRRDCLSEVVWVDPSRAIHRQPGHLRTEAFEEAQRSHDSRMLDAGRDEMRVRARASEENTLQGKVIGFATSAGEHHFARRAAEKCRYLAAGLLDHPASRAAGPVSAGRIAVGTLHSVAHDRRDLRRDWRAGVVVEIDAPHGSEYQHLVGVCGGIGQLVHRAAARALHDIVLGHAACVHAGAAEQHAALAHQDTF